MSASEAVAANHLSRQCRGQLAGALAALPHVLAADEVVEAASASRTEISAALLVVTNASVILLNASGTIVQRLDRAEVRVGRVGLPRGPLAAGFVEFAGIDGMTQFPLSGTRAAAKAVEASLRTGLRAPAALVVAHTTTPVDPFSTEVVDYREMFPDPPPVTRAGGSLRKRLERLEPAAGRSIDEVVRVLGGPMSVGRMAFGQQLMQWQQTSAWSGATHYRLIFDSNGICGGATR